MSRPRPSIPPLLLVLALALLPLALRRDSTAQRPAAPAKAGPIPPHERLYAVLYQQTSAEYLALALSAYGQARRALPGAQADRTWTASVEQAEAGGFEGLPPAVMLDVDETVLDNSPYQARIVLELGDFSLDSFHRWCQEARCRAIPGSVEFLNDAAAKGVRIVYTSGRFEETRAATIRNLRSAGLPFRDGTDVLLLAGSTTEAKRRRVAATHRILLLVGDNLDDFLAGSHAPPDRRRALALSHADRWGTRWFLLPNPTYGHWEASLYDFDFAAPREEHLRREIRRLAR